MYFKNETSRDSFKRPLDKLREVFGETKGFADAEYLDAGRTRVFGVDGLPMKAPVCMFLLGRTEVLCWLDGKDGDILVTYGDSVTEEKAQQLVGRIAEKFDGAEVLAVCGGQPVYHYLISVE